MIATTTVPVDKGFRLSSCGSTPVADSVLVGARVAFLSPFRKN
ncbi:FLZ-type domain-containing protein [Psidium guajava]|nr:FLZ-type domain-containing protein [Psidium guajava]